ncbi:MAG: hypothetical protein EBX91_02825 [Actinobacteria bacterium]|nr:hypothetical protein [Actinomycetota bacterium]
MSDTVINRPSGKAKSGKGLSMERIYTTAGQHPYENVTWERRDVVQTNWKSGEVVFEQRGVEYPDFWSVNASTIVTTKYFRGAVGAENREHSLKQVIDRVVLTYTKAGKEHGYFATPEDAEIFEHELTYMLLHQVFSFNSPVWFNVGTSAPQQVSACFILSVDDTMESILNWYREEGMIFKGGSGAGLNLSRIRSSKELLKSGGTASGPVSFMRGADSSAGTIKSGGATRRAAKMVVLDIDHPDIEEFIETKVREEDKIRALRDAGFDMDLGGKDIISVQYQNANNSVRVTDEFMRAYENKAVEMIITAMDISICFADFPTEAIGVTTRAYRQLGIGYANLGALLMASGLAYDSEGGRALAGAITSLMTGTSYRRSAEMAGIVGPYEGYARNAAPHTRVMKKHQAASLSAKSVSTLDRDVLAEANKQWDSCISLGEKNGWRNAQASVLAPTGTIGLMMDCDTTGIEPDFSLVKFKKMVGGGSLQIVNQTVPQALKKLGYTDETIEAIVEYIAANGHVVDAPGLKVEHYDVFDCALGTRSIAPMGHVRMMAACQPFLSGAISKTVNLPADASVEDVEEVYYEGWKLGLKALAVYRDSCKVGQPLSDAKSKNNGKDDQVSAAPAPATRKRLPKSRPSRTTSFSVGGAEGYMNAGTYEDGQLGEIFLKLGKQGSTLAGVMDAFSIAVSIGLQYGVPLETYVSKFTNSRFEPAGITDDPDIRMAQSMMDYIFRRLALDYLPYEERAAFGIYTAAERAAALETGEYAQIVEAKPEVVEEKKASAPAAKPDTALHQIGSSTELLEKIAGVKSDAPLCVTCGVKMRASGACYVCEGCGNTSGCS